MSVSFSINSKSRSKKPSASHIDSSTINYVKEFRSDSPPEPKISPIAPIPNANKKLKYLPQISQPNGASVQFELDPGSNPEPTGSSMGYGLTIRQPSAAAETISDSMELRILREDLVKLPDGPGLDEYEDVPVEGFGAALLSGYGWKEGRGIGRNAKEDVTIAEVTRKRGRGGLGFTDEVPEPEGRTNAKAGESVIKDRKGEATKRFAQEKEVRITRGREMGMKGKIVEVRNGGQLLVLRMSKNNEKVKVEAGDVVEVGSIEEEKCMRKFKELRVKEEKDRNERRKSVKVEERSERVNWLRNHIRVRIISEDLKGGRLFLKKGVVVDVVGPGLCDISIDESRELVQGVDQDSLETALPKRGGPVIVLYGGYKGVYGSLVERDAEREIGVVQDADTHEMLTLKLEQLAEFTGDPSDIVGY